MSDVAPENLQRVNVQHINFLEGVRDRISVGGVDLLPVLSYELIQIMNHEFLRAALGDDESEGEE